MESAGSPGRDVYRFVVRSLGHSDPRSAGYLTGAHALGLPEVETLECQELFFLEGRVGEVDLERIACDLLSDPISQSVEWGRVLSPITPKLQPENSEPHPPGEWVVEITYHPGVTDPVAGQILRGLEVMGISGIESASTGLRFVLRGPELTDSMILLLARRLLANPTIQRFTLGSILPTFLHPAPSSGQVAILPIRDLPVEGLQALSQDRRAALDQAEMAAIQAYFRRVGRDPTDVEFETLAQTWSEHCVHKTFKAQIRLSRPQPLTPEVRNGSREDGAVIDGLLRTYIRAATEVIGAPWVRSAFVDNAGIIAFDDEWEVSFKVETHNHPSAIEPFGGANTGVGGVIRDLLGVSARPIAATDVLCFGPQDEAFENLPDGVLHPRRIRDGVVAGVQDYGNKIGLPLVNGAILYDPGYTANPLVFCGCVGIAPKGSHPGGPRPGDRVIVLGGRTGRDGLRGATFSSMSMDAGTGQVAGASVQIGDPIVEKGLIEVLVRARDRGLYNAVTDCGAGGLSSAVGEMAQVGGVEIDLAEVRLKYPGLAPWEIWLSEAQERMVLAVPPATFPALADLCADFEVELTDIGAFTASGRVLVRYRDRVVLDLENEFLHEGFPQRRLVAHLPARNSGGPPSTPEPPLERQDFNRTLLTLLSHPNIASKEDVIRIYDHEVQGGSVIRPLVGVQSDGPSDACVLKPVVTSGRRGLVLSNGINPLYGQLDPYCMAVSVVDEAVRNAVAVGADPDQLALLDNFCWGDPLRPETLGGLVEAARGCHDAARHYGAPFISGKDSLNNEHLGSDGQRRAVPPTLLISLIGIIPDVQAAVTMDLKTPDDLLYLVGEWQPCLGGSHLGRVMGWEGGGAVPGLAHQAPAVYRALHGAIGAGLARACHDLSEGGLGVAAAEMCIAGRLGLQLALDDVDPILNLFGEVNGCLLVEVRSQAAQAFEARFAGLPLRRLGRLTAEPVLSVSAAGEDLVSLPVNELLAAWTRHPSSIA